MAKSNHYVDGQELQNELVKSHERGQLTNRAAKLLQLMVDRLSAGLPYKSDDLRQDVKGYAMYVCAKNWQGYDIERNSAFSFFTTTILNGLRQGFKKYRAGKAGTIHISLEQLMNSDKNN